MSSFIDVLLTRRSVPVLTLGEPGPNAEELRQILTAASRVPDHGKLAPWRFILFEGAARQQASERIGALYAIKHPAASDTLKGAVSRVLTHAPVVVAVVSRAAPHPKIPEWEQVLSAGAACMNLVTAANALGFATTWLTGFAGTDPEALSILGVSAEERLAGFIHIGTASERPADRERPALEQIVRRWRDAM